MDQHPTYTELASIGGGLTVRPEIARHVEGCPACQARIAAMAADDEDLLSLRNPAAFARDIAAAVETERSVWRRAWLAIPAFGAVAAIILALVAMWPLTNDPAGRLKGTLSITHQVERGDGLVHPKGGFLYRPGDKLLVDLVSSEDGYISVAYEEDGLLVPIPALQGVPVQKNRIYPIQGKLALGCETGQETIHVFFSREATLGPPDPSMPHRILTFMCE